MSGIRVGAVQYLNARPLVYGLEKQTNLFSINFDVPSKCARQLREGNVDLGLIPSIEYLRRPDYRIVPEIAVASKGQVASVALFTSRPTHAIRSIAVDSSSKTAFALLRILCAQWFEIEPKLHIMAPDLDSMLKRCDAALLIGDTALFTEHETVVDLDKVDLGEEWTAMCGLPFVWAFWVGRNDVLTPDHVNALLTARDSGVQSLDAIVKSQNLANEDQVDIARAYLENNVYFSLLDDELSGLRRFYEAALDVGVVPKNEAPLFYAS